MFDVEIWQRAGEIPGSKNNVYVAVYVLEKLGYIWGTFDENQNFVQI